jgi:hypothetical protein
MRSFGVITSARACGLARYLLFVTPRFAKNQVPHFRAVFTCGHTAPCANGFALFCAVFYGITATSSLSMLASSPNVTGFRGGRMR